MTSLETAPSVRANAHPFGRSFAVAGVAVAAAIVLLFVLLGPPDSPEAAGRVTGRFLFPGVFAALIAGAIARSSGSRWAWWKYAVVVLPIQLGFVMLFGLAALVNSV